MNLCEIERSGEADYKVLLALWEASVRATHDFLSETDIETLKPFVAEAFAAVKLYAIRDQNDAVSAFVGVADAKIEMLFVRPDQFRTGLGRRLVDFAIREMGIRHVDVNEQNPSAYLFYKQVGFRIMGRDAFDAQGNPFPILHLELEFPAGE